MATVEKPMAIAQEDLDALQRTIERVTKGIRDPQAMRQAAERMDRAREEMRQRVGNVNLAVALIRETRDEG